MKRYILNKDNRIIDTKKYDIEFENSNNSYELIHEDTYNVLNIYENEIKKQSDNIFDLIEAGDLVEYKYKGLTEVLDIDEDKTLYLSTSDLFFHYEIEIDNLYKIYKPNKNGDYIKVWEKERKND